MRKLFFIVLIVSAIGVFFTRGGVKAGLREYVVQPGDTLAEIAARYGTTVEELVTLNRDRYPSLVERPDLIEVGWRLRVKGRIWQPAPTPTRRAQVKVIGGQQDNPYTLPDPRVLEEQIIVATNEVRAVHGLPPLERDEELMAIARWRAEDMIRRGYFSHNDPVTGELLVRTRCRGCGENLHQGGVILHGRGPVSSWMNSPGHRANILNPHIRYIGVGVGEGWVGAR